MILRAVLTSVVAITLLARQTIATAATTITGTARISDGDTIRVNGTRIRLYGIDAPETDQVCIDKSSKTYACGIAARDALARLIQGRAIACRGDKIERYGRQIMTCFAGETDINASMVATGWALVFRSYSDIYFRHEQIARAGQEGLWSGAFIAPKDWRHHGPQTEILGAVPVPINAQQHLFRQPVASATPKTSCQIKGNISRNGARIYHVPGQQDYDKTRITETKSERWFCTEDEARAAGWRRARN